MGGVKGLIGRLPSGSAMVKNPINPGKSKLIQLNKGW